MSTMFCRILKSPRKADTYLYLPLEAHVGDLPLELQQLFIPEIEVTRMAINPRRQFARISGVKLLEHLEEPGYYLQLPLPVENLLDTLKSDRES